jgi:hypothetical protein
MQKSAGAFGVFETTADLSRYTKAALFQQSAKTEMLARFSTVAGESGSPDTWRGVRSPVLERVFDYWKSVDADVGRRIEEKVRQGNAPEPAAGMGEADSSTMAAARWSSIQLRELNQFFCLAAKQLFKINIKVCRNTAPCHYCITNTTNSSRVLPLLSYI